MTQQLTSGSSAAVGRGSAPQITAPAKRSQWPWAIAAVLIVFMLLAGGLTFYFMNRAFAAAHYVANAPNEIIAGLGQAFRPEVHYQTQIDTAIGQLKHNPKLVVLTAEVDAEVTKSSATNWGYVYWGTTSVSIRTHGNKVQWYVPLEDVETSDFRYDAVHKTLTLSVLPPVFDADMVSVQSDPSQVEVTTNIGWAKLDGWSGAPLREDAKRDLRPAVVRAGRHELLETKARVNAKEHLKKLLSPLAGTLQPDVIVEVEFKPSPTGSH